MKTLLMLFIVVSTCLGESTITPYQLLCEAKENPTGLSTVQPRFSWKNKADENKAAQSAFQILAASKSSLLQEGKADLWDSGRVKSDQSVWISYNGKPLQSRSVVYWKMRVWDQQKNVSAWSKVAHFSIGLLNADDWTSDYIGISEKDGEPSSPFLRKTFELNETYDELYLHVNSLGYHEIFINGQKVGDAHFTPAESQYDKRSFSLSYDISSYLKKGQNAIVLWLGNGWYQKTKVKVHTGPLVRAQLSGLQNGKWQTIVKTDSSWKANESQYSFADPKNSGYGGEILNANKIIHNFSAPDLDDSNWHQATVFQVPHHSVTPQDVELNRVQDDIHPIEIIKIDDQVYLIDMGKNLTGGMTINVPALPKNHKIKLQYTDHADPQISNLYDKQFDYYISNGEKGVFSTKFDYHAFRYIKISNAPFLLKKEDITAHLIHTDFRDAATFSCSDDMLNQLHDMFAYTLKCLTLGGKIVDCPHFERLGYGGDGNACTITTQTLYDQLLLFTTWLTHWADCIEPNGSMPHTAPSFWKSGGGPYWCTFIVKAAWETYVNYGDARILETFYPTMLHWFEYVKKYSPNTLLDEWPTTEHRNWYLGDWATPEGIDQTDPRSVGLVTNCAIIDAYDKMINIARVLEKQSDAKLFSDKKIELAKAVHATFYNPESATYATGVQVDLAYPLILGIVPDSLVSKVTASLMTETLDKWNGHFATGLVGLPILTDWAVENEESNLFYTMMTKKDYPGFGYMIENGATTTWEHWNGHRSRIHNCYHGTGSWFYQSIGGIRPLAAHPGYEEFVLAPRPPQKVTWAHVSKETPFGTIKIDWEYKNEKMVIDARIPVGSRANLLLPDGVSCCHINGQKVTPNGDGHILIENGVYDIKY